MLSRSTSESLCAAGLLFLAWSGPLWACGPFFPNTVIFSPDRTVLSAPIADFRAEMDRLLPKSAPAFRAVIAEPTDGEETRRADIKDLKAALADSKLPSDEREKLLGKAAALRVALVKHGEQVLAWWAGGADPRRRPNLANIAIPDGLPGEFADYLRGAVAYHDRKMDDARKAWQGLLDRPEKERKYRSTWAAYMIGRSLVEKDPQASVKWFQKVRELAKAGFADTLGLAAASYGWQGRAELDQGHYRNAIELYLAQHATGDPTAAMSLRNTAAHAFADGEKVLRHLAPDPVVRPVLTAFVVARGGPFGSSFLPDKAGEVWLSAVESAGATAVQGADRLAWAAYQISDLRLTERWLKRARADSPVTQWIWAKLMLRQGKLDKAAELLAGVVKELPADEKFLLKVVADDESRGPGQSSPVHVAAGELAVLKLARNQYVDALDLLMKHGYWTDAAYVAERVLAPEELIAYVDNHWTAKMAERWSADRGPDTSKAEDGLAWQAHDIRHLLARRLVRLGRCKEARQYFPPNLQEKLDAYVQGIRDGADAKLPAGKRAAGLWESAKLARFWGMALLATELEPDGAIDQGQYGERLEGGQMKAARVRSEEDKVVPATDDERKRATANVVEPDKRFHYRYVAADHAWAAARLMPDNADETARVLWEAGCWLKGRDPQAADRFYKALVRRCGKTRLGQEADKLRWFPTSAPAATTAEAVKMN